MYLETPEIPQEAHVSEKHEEKCHQKGRKKPRPGRGDIKGKDACKVSVDTNQEWKCWFVDAAEDHDCSP